jgi:sodium-dependent phosphate cotransporter
MTTNNPIVGVFIGILATSVMQSSSSTTSITVGMVSGGVLTIESAVPIVMGANVGTSVTNTLVALGHINHSEEMKRSFAASTVHDVFNLLSLLVLFPLQYFTGFLSRSAVIMGSEFQDLGGIQLFNPLKIATTPIIGILERFLGNYPWFLLIASVFLLFLTLKCLMTLLKGYVLPKASFLFDRMLFKTALRAFLLGLLITMGVQSSSIVTSIVVPLAAAGLLTLDQIFPYTLGANVGTTFTAILASLATANVNAITVAFSHLLFNIFGIMFWWPFRKLPISLARILGQLAERSKVIPLIYILMVFFIIPIAVIIFL